MFLYIIKLLYMSKVFCNFQNLNFNMFFVQGYISILQINYTWDIRVSLLSCMYSSWMALISQGDCSVEEEGEDRNPESGDDPSLCATS